MFSPDCVKRPNVATATRNCEDNRVTTTQPGHIYHQRPDTTSRIYLQGTRRWCLYQERYRTTPPCNECLRPSRARSSSMVERQSLDTEGRDLPKVRCRLNTRESSSVLCQGGGAQSDAYSNHLQHTAKCYGATVNKHLRSPTSRHHNYYPLPALWLVTTCAVHDARRLTKKKTPENRDLYSCPPLHFILQAMAKNNHTVPRLLVYPEITKQVARG